MINQWQHNLNPSVCVQTQRGGRVCPVSSVQDGVERGVLSTILTGAVYQATNMIKDFAHEPGGSYG